VLITDGMTGLKSIDVKDAKDGTILIDLYGIERLHRLLGEGLTRDNITLDVVAETGKPLMWRIRKPKFKSTPNKICYNSLLHNAYSAHPSRLTGQA
jgi:hypothetical protein